MLKETIEKAVEMREKILDEAANILYKRHIEPGIIALVIENKRSLDYVAIPVEVVREIVQECTPSGKPMLPAEEVACRVSDEIIRDGYSCSATRSVTDMFFNIRWEFPCVSGAEAQA